MEEVLLRQSFRAMGTQCELVGAGVTRADFQEAFEYFEREASAWESIFSRFLPESELCRLNRANGRPVEVSAVFLDVLERAIEGRGATDGRFDPFIIGAVEAAGYDRSFEAIDLEGGKLAGAAVTSEPIGDGSVAPGIHISHRRRTAQLSPGTRMDLGGIAKGAFVDRMRPIIESWTGGIIDAGGDLALSGNPLDGDGWRIGIQFPGRPDSDIATVTLPDGATYGVATSSTQQRRWQQGDRWQNHLIDPATGLPVTLSTPNVTVIGESTTWAEIESKSLLVALSRGGPVPPFRSSVAVVAYESGHYETYGPTEADPRSLDARDASSAAA